MAATCPRGPVPGSHVEQLSPSAYASFGTFSSQIASDRCPPGCARRRDAARPKSAAAGNFVSEHHLARYAPVIIPAATVSCKGIIRMNAPIAGFGKRQQQPLGSAARRRFR
jgi:hypothetical protein